MYHTLESGRISRASELPITRNYFVLTDLQSKWVNWIRLRLAQMPGLVKRKRLQKKTTDKEGPFLPHFLVFLLLLRSFNSTQRQRMVMKVLSNLKVLMTLMQITRGMRRVVLPKGRTIMAIKKNLSKICAEWASRPQNTLIQKGTEILKRGWNVPNFT